MVSLPLLRRKKLLAFVALTLALLSLCSARDASQPPASALPLAGLRPEQEVLMAKNQQRFEFQSDISRLMKVVVSHLYHDRDVFLRELISNSGDALEKLRFASLTDSKVLDSAPALNISIIADQPSKRLIIRDSGVGMTREELQKNLGTIARSGTSEFLSKLEKSAGQDPSAGSGTGSNLIGQFGLGFYSSFLVADRVLVSSKSNADEKQWIFESNADAAEFKISEDPRGPSLGRGTEITLYLKDDALDFLETEKLKSLVSTHSEYSTTAPIYIWTEKEVEVPVEEEPPTEDALEQKKEEADDKSESDSQKTEEKQKSPDGEETTEKKADSDQEDDMKVDDDEDSDDDEAEKLADSKPKTKMVKQNDWEQINTKGPIWSRDPKTVSDEEYITFYKASTGISEDPVSWVHFKGDAGRTAFHGLIYLPGTLPSDFYSKSYAQLESVKLFVRKVLITKEPSPDFIPKWLNWIKVIVDADDLPLNVGRDSLQVTKSLKQIQNIVLKKFIDHLSALTKKDADKYAGLWKKIGTTLKVGVVEDTKHRDKLAKLLRFRSSQAGDETVSLEDYVSRRKKNQKQIYFIAGTGMEAKDLAKSPFVEKLVARGYEVLYLTDPVDEMITVSLSTFDGLKFQDVAKKGLQMGDEADNEDEKATLETYKKQYEPLAQYIKKQLEEFVSDVVISNRLTTSPCAVVADSYAWTGNMERLMTAQNQQKGEGSNFMLDFVKKAKKTFEINPRHPLIQGLLTKVEEAGGDESALKEGLKPVVQILWDTSLVRSGFSVADTGSYFERIELLLRKSVGVDEKAETEVGDIKPAPPVEEGPLDSRAADQKKDGESSGDKVQLNSDGTAQASDESKQEWQEWSDMKDKLRDEKPTTPMSEQAATPLSEDAPTPQPEVAAKTQSEEPEPQPSVDDPQPDNLDKGESDVEDGDDEDFDLPDLDKLKRGMPDFDKLKEQMPELERMREQLMKDFGGFKDEL